jgi:hypothetical protein
VRPVFGLFLLIPPGTRSATRPWSRHAVLFCAHANWLWRRDSSRSTVAWSSTRTGTSRGPAGRRWRLTGHRWSRSCPSVPSPTAAPATPGWPGCPRPFHRRRGAAGPTGSQAHRRTPPPRSGHRCRAGRPTPPARVPAGAWPAPAARSTPARGRRSRLRCGSLCGSIPIMTIVILQIQGTSGPRWALLI